MMSEQLTAFSLLVRIQREGIVPDDVKTSSCSCCSSYASETQCCRLSKDQIARCPTTFRQNPVCSSASCQSCSKSEPLSRPSRTFASKNQAIVEGWLWQQLTGIRQSEPEVWWSVSTSVDLTLGVFPLYLTPVLSSAASEQSRLIRTAPIWSQPQKKKSTQNW